MAIANNAWAVRSKPHNIDRIKEFLDKSMAAIGWPELGDLTGLSAAQIRETYVKEYPGENQYAVGQRVGLIDRFVNIQKGDIIAVPYGQKVYFGTVKSEYSFHEELTGDDEGYPHWVGVDYAFDGHAILRNQLSAKLHTAAKGWLSVFGLPLEDAQDVIDNPDRYLPSASSVTDDQKLLEEYVLKLKAGRVPGINENRFEDAVQTLLSCYFPGIVRLGKQNAPPGADTDLLASLPGNVVVRVQVKCYREQLGKLGVDAVTQLRESMNAGDNGIIVTTNEASTEAVKRAERSNEMPITIIDVNEFAEMVFANIDSFDKEDLHRLGLARSTEIQIR